MHRLGLAVPSTLRGGEHTCVAANEQIVHWSKCRIDSWQWGRSRRTRRRWQRRSAVWPAQWHPSWHISWHTSWHTSRMMWMMWMMWMHCSFRNGARLTLQSGPGTRPLMSKRKKVSTQRCQQINALVLRTCAPQHSLCCRRPHTFNRRLPAAAAAGVINECRSGWCFRFQAFALVACFARKRQVSLGARIGPC